MNQNVFKALADPTRRSILKRLRSGSCSAGKLAELFPIRSASLSYHFNVLKNAELVRTERRGQRIVYSLNTTVMEEVAVVLMEMFGQQSNDGDS